MASTAASLASSCPCRSLRSRSTPTATAITPKPPIVRSPWSLVRSKDIGGHGLMTTDYSMTIATARLEDRLERGDIITWEPCPIMLPTGDDLTFLLQQQLKS